ncbi:MAG: heme-binding protein [Nitrosomonas sp.]|nr:heme-binding protein [Nitrosomonas sp.]MCC7135970.1 heme-binding protein [Nitrosomonas sp.]
MMKINPVLGFSLIWVAGIAVAEPLPREAFLPLDLAYKAVQVAIHTCQKNGYRVSVSVVDRAGVLRAMGRDDGAGPHTVDSSRRKAYTAASMRRTTSELAGMVSQNPTLKGLHDMNEQILILGGGLPIEIAGEVVGGIGVGGAPGTQLDDACAQAGLHAINATPGSSRQK